MGLRVKEVHVSPFSLAQTGLFTKNLGHHLVDVDPFGDEMAVRPMGAGHRVIRSQVGAHTRRDRFLPAVEMHLAGDRPGRDIKRGQLVLVIHLAHPLFKRADFDDVAIELQRSFLLSFFHKRHRTIGGCHQVCG